MSNLPSALHGLGAKVLVVDDAPDTRLFLQTLLERAGYVVEVASKAEEAAQMVGLSAPDLMIADISMPEIDGLELTRRIKAQARGFLPVLLLTGRNSLQDRISGLTAGADDYLAKPIDPVDLMVRSAALLRIRNLTLEAERHRSDLLTANARLEHVAATDLLTGILSRRACEQHLRACIDKARMSGGACGVLLADVDRFKNINDTWGHPMGDTVLVAVSGALTRALRPGDVIGRWGGEEFCVVLNGTNPPIEAIAERLRKAVSDLSVMSDDSTPIRVTISIGGARCCIAGVVEGSPQIISIADKALYSAKQRGRNCVVVTSGMEQRTTSWEL